MNPPAPATRIGSVGEMLWSMVIPLGACFSLDSIVERTAESNDFNCFSVLGLREDAPAVDYDAALRLTVARFERKIGELGPGRRDHHEIRSLEQLDAGCAAVNVLR